MQKDAILHKIMDSCSLPTLSTVISKLISLPAREENTLYDITKLIAQDISLSAKVLKVDNSSFYNFPNQVGSIQQAVAILGTNAVRSLVLSFSFLGMEQASESGGSSYTEFWEGSMAAQVSATPLMSQVCDEDTEEVFTVSLLANILYSGKPIDYHKPFREQAKKSFRLDDETIDRLLERVNVEVANATEFFGIKIGGTPSIPELLQEVKIELSLLSMSYVQIREYDLLAR